MTWLDTALVEAGQKRAADFFGPIRYQDKASLVALPVFFRQVDACLITSNSFKVMGELNPQLHKQLRVLALSPDVIPSFFAFCARDPSLVSPEVITAMTEMHQSTAGKQILTLVKADCIVERPVNCLQPSLDLLAKHDRLCGEATP
jgi:phosphonate transport system substrate-binding protein